MIGYMVTWTTYGTWLQGSKRGYVKNGEVRGACARLKESNRSRQKDRRFVLTKENREWVRRAILDEAGRLGQEVVVMAISTTHVHMVVDVIDEAIETAVARYKRAATKALRAKGITGKLWTRGYDKRFCFDEKSLKDRIGYVRRHD
ncbi:MAG: transposase [Planctomycetota bacterium]